MFKSIYYKRLTRSIRRNGLLYTILRIPRNVSFSKYAFDFRRKLFLKEIYQQLGIVPDNVYILAGYPFNDKFIRGGGVCLSFGLYDDISFERALAKYMNVYAFDPSPISRRLFGDLKIDNFLYIPRGVWTEDGAVKFYRKDSTRHLSNEKQEYSVTNIDEASDFELFEVSRLSTIMSTFSLSEIDVLKMDIEGAVPMVLLDHLRSGGMLPRMMTFELEIPSSKSDCFDEVTKDIRELVLVLALSYEVYYLPKADHWSHLIIYAEQKQ